MPSKNKGRQTRRKRKSHVSADVIQDVLALALFLVFAGSILIFAFPRYTGSAGFSIREKLLWLVGLPAYGTPLLILLLGITALPLAIRQRSAVWVVKVLVLILISSLLFGSFGGPWESAGGILGSYFRGLLKEPYLGVFYPLILITATIALIILLTGKVFIVPVLQVVEKAIGEYVEVAKAKRIEKMRSAETEKLEEEAWASAEIEQVGEILEHREDAQTDSTANPPAIALEETEERKPPQRVEDLDDAAISYKRQLKLDHPHPDYKLPPVELLEDAPFSPLSEEALKKNAQVIDKTLSSFNITAQVISWEVGPRVTRYELKIGPGINVSRLHSLADNLALELAVPAVRLETPIPGRSAIGIEVPNTKFNKIALRGLMESAEMRSTNHPLAFPVGRDLAGKPVIGNIHHMHHLLIAGSTGSGKSVCINSLLIALLYRNTPATARFILIDPKRVELSVFKGIPHLATPIVHDINEAQSALRWVVAEMESRLSTFEQAGVRNIDVFNETAEPEAILPYILVVVDELADLIKSAGPVFERLIARIAHLARAAGIHLVVATQRPDATVITGNIKMNIPSRISFAVVSQIDSRTILDMPGAEKLLGSGDMLYFPVGVPKPIRVQGAWVRDDEVRRVVDFVRRQAEPEYLQEIAGFAFEEETEGELDDEELDPLYSQAYEVVVNAGRASTSLLQRRLKIGYNRAARIMEQMERMGVVSPADHQGNRELLIPGGFDEETEDREHPTA